MASKTIFEKMEKYHSSAEDSTFQNIERRLSGKESQILKINSARSVCKVSYMC